MVVEDVYARYRDTVQRQYRQLEHGLNLKMESPHPQSRLRLSQGGIEMTIRYPTDTSHEIELSDEISRRVLDTIAKDPGGRRRAADPAVRRPSITIRFDLSSYASKYSANSNGCGRRRVWLTSLDIL